MRPFIFITALTIGFSVPPLVVASAQSPPASESQPDFSGTWQLDQNLSNDPAGANFGSPDSQGNQRNGGGGGGFGGGGRYGPIGGFGRPRYGGNRNAAGASTPLEQSRIKDLTDEIKKASSTLVISHHDPTLVINDSADYTQFFETNGTSNDHPFPSGTITSTTHWDGTRLVTEYTISSRQKLVYTYTVLPTRQMVLRVRLDTDGGRGRPEELKLVYNLAPSGPK
jgi:hypothetical protein